MSMCESGLRLLALLLCCALLPAPARAQQPALTSADSALVGRILLAEDQRDVSNPALAEGARHPDQRIQLLARRATARIGDPKFASRDSFPKLPAPPAYQDPAWRLRYRALTPSDCLALRGALADSVWAVRLHAIDLVSATCAHDSLWTRALITWVRTVPPNASRLHATASWQPAAHALVALARTRPEIGRRMLPVIARKHTAALRVYAARTAAILNDTSALRTLARDPDDNVMEAAIDGLSKVAGHSADDIYLLTLSARGYQAVRAAARALAGSSRKGEVLNAALAAERRLRNDSSETSRDARLALLERVSEQADPAHAMAIAALATDFDCAVAQAAATIAARLAPTSGMAPKCTRLPVRLSPDAVALALGRDARLRVVMADSSGGGSFVVRLRGDVAPIMAARILELARAHYYDGLTWQRVETDFVIQGGSPHANEYAGNPRFIRDELGTVPHVRGAVGMSTRGHDTGDAQWFVNLRDNLRLNADYTVFGEVVEGIDIVDGVLEGDVIARIEVL
ncbi:MAG TPA: peptidylprolyl isomerase [Gemmatimonadaceae bacterium]|jgi:cyclophilin family peptidyl-prolyl cis-trans isomerase